MALSVLQLPQEQSAPLPHWQVGCQRSVMTLVPCSLTDHLPRVVKLPPLHQSLGYQRALALQVYLTILLVVFPLVLKTKASPPLVQHLLVVRPRLLDSIQCRFHPFLAVFCHFLPWTPRGLC